MKKNTEIYVGTKNINSTVQDFDIIIKINRNHYEQVRWAINYFPHKKERILEPGKHLRFRVGSIFFLKLHTLVHMRLQLEIRAPIVTINGKNKEHLTTRPQFHFNYLSDYVCTIPSQKKKNGKFKLFVKKLSSSWNAFIPIR